jgi:membrane-bound inhibitor of C-type lysozyme
MDISLPTLFKCPKCDELFRFVKKLDDHVQEKHQCNLEQLYIELYCNNIRPTCKCGCGKPCVWYGWKQGFTSEYVRGHNALSRVFLSTKETIEKRKKRYASGELQAWNKGKTKETDVRLQNLSEKVSTTLKTKYATGEITSWISGLTAEIDERVRNLSEKSAATQREQYKNGELVPWAKGLSAETDERVLKIATDLKQKYETGERISWNKGHTAETDDRILNWATDLKQKYETGELVGWATGLTKETSEAIKKSSETRKRKFKTGEIKNWTQGLTKETDVRIKNISIKMSNRLRNLHKVSPAYRTLSEEEIMDRIKEFDDKFDLVSIINTSDRPYKVLSRDILQLRCKQCNNIVEKTYKMLKITPVCFVCNPTGSKGQLELFEFVKSICSDTISSDRTAIYPQELDIYIPSKKVAIEYNGLYWHSDKLQKNENYHSDKTASCISHNISLLHIFSDEWEDKPEIIKSIIRNKLGLSPTKIFARKCKLELATNEERILFFNSTHLDGDAAATIAWKLVYNNEIVAMLSLRRAFHKLYNNYIELCRFSTALNTSVVGGLGKLLKSARAWTISNNYKGIMTYVDTRFGDGHGYLSVGFKHISTTKNRFWWTDFYQRFNRFKIRANKPAGITQEQAALDAGVSKIFGCPNKVFILEISQECNK